MSSIDDILKANRCNILHELEHPDWCKCKRMEHKEAKAALLAAVLGCAPEKDDRSDTITEYTRGYVAGRDATIAEFTTNLTALFGGEK